MDSNQREEREQRRCCCSLTSLWVLSRLSTLNLLPPAPSFVVYWVGALIFLRILNFLVQQHSLACAVRRWKFTRPYTLLRDLCLGPIYLADYVVCFPQAALHADFDTEDCAVFVSGWRLARRVLKKEVFIFIFVLSFEYGYSRRNGSAGLVASLVRTIIDFSSVRGCFAHHFGLRCSFSETMFRR